jgi:hypothetical protein
MVLDHTTGLPNWGGKPLEFLVRISVPSTHANSIPIATLKLWWELRGACTVRLVPNSWEHTIPSDMHSEEYPFPSRSRGEGRIVTCRLALAVTSDSLPGSHLALDWTSSSGIWKTHAVTREHRSSYIARPLSIRFFCDDFRRVPVGRSHFGQRQVRQDGHELVQPPI